MIIPIKPWLELADSSGGVKGSSFDRGMVASGLCLAADAERESMIRDGSISWGMNTELGMSDRMEFYHEPIMGAEILSYLQPIEGKQIFDGTLGGGGHTELFLREGAHVIGCDQDGGAIEHATRRLAAYEDRFLPVRGNFSEMNSLLAGVGVDAVDGVLLDLGVSSRQLDDISRGFSFRGEAESSTVAIPGSTTSPPSVVSSRRIIRHLSSPWSSMIRVQRVSATADRWQLPPFVTSPRPASHI